MKNKEMTKNTVIFNIFYVILYVYAGYFNATDGEERTKFSFASLLNISFPSSRRDIRSVAVRTATYKTYAAYVSGYISLLCVIFKA